MTLKRRDNQCNKETQSSDTMGTYEGEALSVWKGLYPDVHQIKNYYGDDFFTSSNALLDSHTVDKHRGTRIMVFARKRSGSSVTGSYIGKNPDFFYFYEPGRIVSRHIAGIGGERFDFLEKIRPQLLSFLDGIYSCNFTGHKYFISDMNETPLYRNKGAYPLKAPLSIDNITQYCLSKKHIVTKVLRLYNLLLAAPLLRKYNIKVIHLVRDPRGLVKSREMFEATSKFTATEGELHLNDRLEGELVDYCRWMETNYLQALNAPSWLRTNYMLVRYEDIAARPEEVVPKLYEFIGVSAKKFIKSAIQTISNSKPGNGEAWRNGVTFENVQKMQALCPERIWKMFGYRLVNSIEMLHDSNTSLVEDMPARDQSYFEEVYFNKVYET
ncbi:carbohydrate sulfotransferase 3-like [Ptychodera flava]|uniref:carbohydrate sulfotransferase 3-like n=1 Tax=Ptychodera flava TaxID=63121 RepID=UPI00396A330D